MMKNNLQKISLKYKNSIVCPLTNNEGNNHSLALMFQAEIMRLGYLLSEELFETLCTLDEDNINTLFREVVPILWDLKGADKKWRMFYPKFPKQVMKMSDEQLFVNAICHYWSHGTWQPTFTLSKRLPKMESVKFTVLEKTSKAECLSIFTDLLSSNVSHSESSLADLLWFMHTYGEDLKAHMPEVIPFKETLCTFVGASLNLGQPYALELMKSATDILRVMTHLSEGDISLAENTKFRSWKRSERKQLLQALENCVREDDVARHGEKWKRAFHGLHIGDYAKLVPQSYTLAQKLRDGKLRTFNGKVEAAITKSDCDQLFALLGSRPGELARRLDHLLRSLNEEQAAQCIELFRKVANRINTRVLLQLLGHFKERALPVTERVVMPKGLQSKARIIKKVLPAMPESQVVALSEIIHTALIDHFSEKKPLGKVWIDPRLAKCPVPMAQRSASETLRSVARGTRLDLGKKNTLRLFVWWVGKDVDLSCVLYNQTFKKIGHISYTNLKIEDINCCHSGDITYAPKGAAEFIDIDMKKAAQKGVRYVMMNVLDYSGLMFSGYDECFAGWMTRSHPNHNEVYDPKSVEQKIDLRTPNRLATPVLFDIIKKEAIWLDLQGKGKGRLPNNVESNAATIEELVQAALILSDKLNLHELFSLHTAARGEFVENKSDADTVFSIDEGITPFDLVKIGSEFIT